MDACPKCGKAVEAGARICAACGVIISKVRPKGDAASMSPGPVAPQKGRPLPPPLPLPPTRTTVRPTLASPGPAESEADAHASGGSAMLKIGLATAAAIGALFVLNRAPSTPAPSALTAPAQASLPEPPRPAEVSTKDAPTLTAEDVAFLNALSSRLQKSPDAAPTEAEIERVERLRSANPQSAPLKELLMGVYFRRTDHDLRLGSFALVDQTLGKMKMVDDQQAQVYAVEASVRAQQSDWEGTLAAVEKYESLSGDATLAMSYNLAVALGRLNRRPDALAVLDRPIFQTCATASSPNDRSVCMAVRQMKEAFEQTAAGSGQGPSEERPRAALNVDASKEQIQSEKFDVRFDGENQSGVARDVLFVLDRAYTRLADIYYDRPARKIPVVLHSSQDYFTQTGAPWWSGGVYSSHNGAIQIPIRGLPSTLPRQMEDVLVHELSHAFVDEMSGGFAGRALQEGLAQYMEGKRVEQELSAAELKRLANSSGGGVGSFYMLSLAISEQLVQSRGQGMVNQLLKAMKEAGSEDGGFKKVFGQSGTAMKKDILETFWRRYS